MIKQIILNGVESGYMIDDNLIVRNKKGHIMKPILWSRNRYYMHSFSMNGKKVRVQRHRLIGEYFIPLTEGYSDISKLQINHKDGNGLNNSLDNLEWVTEEDNIRHSFENNLSKIGGTPYKRLTAENLETHEVSNFPSIRQASIKLNISIASLSIKSRKSKEFIHKNYKIKMLE